MINRINAALNHENLKTISVAKHKIKLDVSIYNANRIF